MNPLLISLTEPGALGSRDEGIHVSRGTLRSWLNPWAARISISIIVSGVLNEVPDPARGLSDGLDRMIMYMPDHCGELYANARKS